MMFPPHKREQLAPEEARRRELDTFRATRAQHTDAEQQRTAAHQQELERLHKALAFPKEVQAKVDAKKAAAQRQRGDASRSDAFAGMADVERTLVRLGLDAGSQSVAAASSAAAAGTAAAGAVSAATSVTLPALIQAESLRGVVLGGQTKRVVQTDSDIDAARKRAQQQQQQQQQSLQNEEKLAAIRGKKDEDEQHARDRIKRQYVLDVEAGRAAAEQREREERAALLQRARNVFSTERDRVFERLKQQAAAEVDRQMTARVVQAQASLFAARAMTEEQHVVETARERRRIATDKFQAERAAVREQERLEEEIRARENTAFAHAIAVGIVGIAGDIIEHNEAIMLQTHSGTPHDPVSVSHWARLGDKHLGPAAIEREERLYLEELLEAERGELQQAEEDAAAGDDDHHNSSPLSPKNRRKEGGIDHAVLGARHGRRMTTTGSVPENEQQQQRGREVVDAHVTKLFSMHKPYEAPTSCIARATVMADLPGLSGRAKTITAEEKLQFRAATVLDGALTRTVETELHQLSARDAAVTLDLLSGAVTAGTDAEQRVGFKPTAPMTEGQEPPTALVLVGSGLTQLLASGVVPLARQIDEFNARAVAAAQRAASAAVANGARNTDDDNNGGPPMRIVVLNRATMSGADVLESAVAEALSWGEGISDFATLAAAFSPPDAGGLDGAEKSGLGGGAPSGVFSKEHGKSVANLRSGTKSGALKQPTRASPAVPGQQSPSSNSTTARSTGRGGNSKNMAASANAQDAAAAAAQSVSAKPAAPEFLSFDEAVVAAMGFELYARERHRRASREHRAAVEQRTEAQMGDFLAQHEEVEKKRFLRRSLGKMSAAEEQLEAAEAERSVAVFRQSARASAVAALPPVPPRPWTLYLVVDQQQQQEPGSANSSSSSSSYEKLAALAEALGDSKRNTDTLLLTTPRPTPPADGTADFSTIPPLEKAQVVPYRFRVPASSLRILQCSPADITSRIERAMHASGKRKAGGAAAAAMTTTVTEIFRRVLEEVAEERDSLQRLVLLPSFGPAGAVHGELCLNATDSLPDEIMAALRQSDDGGTSPARGSSASLQQQQQQQQESGDAADVKWYRCVPATLPAPSKHTRCLAGRLGEISSALASVAGSGHRHHPEEAAGAAEILDNVLVMDFVEGFRGLRDAEAFAFSRFSQAADAVTRAVAAPWEGFTVEALSHFGPVTPEGDVLTAAAALSHHHSNHLSPSGSSARRPPPLLAKSINSGNAATTSSSAAAAATTSNLHPRSNSPTSRLTPFMATAAEVRSRDVTTPPSPPSTAPANSSSALREIVRHRLWQWYDVQRSALIASVAEQLSDTAFALREMAILNVRAAAQCLRTLLWCIVKDRRLGADGGGGPSSGASMQTPEQSGSAETSGAFSARSLDDLECPLSLWTSLVDDLAMELPSLAALCGGATGSTEFMQLLGSGAGKQQPPLFASLLPACNAVLSNYAKVLLADAASLDHGVPSDVHAALLSPSSSWTAFVASFFETHVAARIRFVEQWREQLAVAARRWIIYGSDKYRQAVQSPAVLRAAVADVKRAQEVVRQQQSFNQSLRRASALLPGAAASSSPSSPAATQQAILNALAGRNMQNELAAATDGFPRPADATVLMALNDVIRVSSSPSSSSPSKPAQQQTAGGASAQKSAEQQEIEHITTVVETQLFRDDGSNMAVGVSDATTAAGNAKQQQQQQQQQQQSCMFLHPPHIKLSSLHIRFLLLHFGVATAAQQPSSSGGGGGSTWSFVSEGAFVHAMLSAQVCLLGRVLHMSSPLSPDNNNNNGAAGSGGDDSAAAAAATRRRNKLALPTCASSAFDLFVPAQRWWCRKEAILEAVHCLRRGIASAQLDSEAYGGRSGGGADGKQHQQQQQQQQQGVVMRDGKKRLPVPRMPIQQPPEIIEQQRAALLLQQQQAAALAASVNPAVSTRHGGAVAAPAVPVPVPPPAAPAPTVAVPATAGSVAESGNDGTDTEHMMSDFANAEVLVDGAAFEGSPSAFMDELDDLLGDGFDAEQDSFGSTQHSQPARNSKPSTAQSAARAAAARANTSRQSQRAGVAVGAPMTPKPPSAQQQQQQQPRGAALINQAHREAVLGLRGLQSLRRDFEHMLATAPHVDASSSTAPKLPLELFFASLILGNGRSGSGSRPAGATKVCTVADAAAVTRSVVRSSDLYRQLLSSRSPTPVFSSGGDRKSPTSPGDGSSSSNSASARRLLRCVRNLSVNTVRELAALPCFAQQSSIATTTGPSADMCALWDALTLNVSTASNSKAPAAAAAVVPFTRLIPLLASDDAYLSRCERRFVIASCFGTPEGVDGSNGKEQRTPTKQPARNGGGDPPAAAQPVVQVDTAALRIGPAQLAAAFLDEPVDGVVLQLVTRDAAAGVTFHGHICSLWGQEAWNRVNPRCLPLNVW